jgi:septal ring factor EnvC (AmiA/AmiB activator)
MRRLLFIYIFIVSACNIFGQSRRELEEQRKRTLEEISYVDNLIKETEKQKTTGIYDIKVIGNRVSLRENIISGYQTEILLLEERIELNNLAVSLMEKDLELLKEEYARTILNSYKTSKSFPEIGYLLSAKDFNQGYKRLRYLQQMARFRRRETEIISELKMEINDVKEKMKEDLNNISGLKKNEELQKSILLQEQKKKRQIVNSLINKEKQLRKELEDKKKIAQKIELEINKIIEEERKRNVSNDLTPEMKLISENFIENKGRLPWPVERGIITERFGEQDHPVLTYIKENNPGIEITCNGKVMARSVFKGEVVRVFAIQGANMSIIIKHGKYFSVYQNLVNVKVAKGQMVEIKQELGEVFCDEKSGSSSVLKFMIFEEREKVDPETWLSKK